MSCNIGFYLNNLKCLTCHKDCKTCIKGGNDNDENCQSCNNNLLNFRNILFYHYYFEKEKK